ncbi:MAG: 4Fe-4S binding protein [Deltaproteobacteria bacterium]|nr:4Fe-4S binding protein [Deltaproteobacteria bacterium]
MRVEDTKCFGCEACIPYCPVEAISMRSDGIASVDWDICVECGNCQRAAQEICGAFYREEESLQWPRVLRAALSDTAFVSPLPQVKARGRGGGEKTNDVEGNFLPGEMGVQVELGRPNSGVSFKEVEKFTKALAQIGIQFDPAIPTTRIMDDPSRGTFPEEVLKQRTLTVYVSFKTDEPGFDRAMEVIADLCRGLTTLATITLIRKVEPGQEMFPTGTLDRLGYSIQPNGKVNLGLGKPAYDFTERRQS